MQREREKKAWLGHKLNTKSTTLNYFPTVIPTSSIQFLTFGCCWHILAEIVLLRSVFFFPAADCLAVLNLIRTVQPGGVKLAFWRHACNSGVSSDTWEELDKFKCLEAKCREKPWKVRARTYGTKSPSRSEALRFIDDIQWCQRTNFTAPGCADTEGRHHRQTNLSLCG